MKPSSFNVWSRGVRRERGERGAVMFLLAAAVIVVSLGAAIAVDLGVVANRGQRLQNAADAAALAGVQAYRASNGDEAVAEAAVASLLEQNGIVAGGSTTFTVEFPDEDNDTEVVVTVTDTNPGTLLSGVTGSDSDVARSATAKFDSCAANCTVNVEIPSPFRSVEAEGTGDGYKPIIIDNELYALNHNSSAGLIVCIDRDTADDPDILGICEGWSEASKPAYATGLGSQRNPEMPHTAVVGTRIYWTASNSSGTHLFCFETATATPCSNAFWINDESRASSSDISNQKDRNRGGGTVLAGDRIFVFTDDHRVHCVVPGVTLTVCSGYEANGKASFLGADNFPVNDPDDGNHGSSIDRIVDETAGKIYWTLHVPTGPLPPADCSQDNQETPNGLVSIRNAASDLFIRAAGGSSISESGTNDDEDTHWIATAEGFDAYGTPRFSFENVANGRVLDSDSGNPRDLETSSSVRSDDRWSLVYGVTTSTLQSYYGTYAAESGTDFVTQNDLNGLYTDWIIKHPNCFDPAYTGGPDTAVVHGPGTWLQCWDFVNDQSCGGFTPSAIHTDGARFSGRLFFHKTNASTPTNQGVCSTGFATEVATSNFEVTCVDNASGLFESDLTSNLDAFRGSIAGVTDNSPAAWGDPHYNEDSNRLFYPTAHDRSRVVCWDFDFGMCGVHEQTSALGDIEDYGYVSEGDCVYGLGHNAYFYAFQAEDIYSECTGSTARTEIRPCDCSGDWEWGTVTFDVDLSLFDEFFIQVVNSSGDLVYPPPAFPGDNPRHSLHLHGITIDLNGLPVSSDAENDFLEILVSVSSDSDPWAQGEQTFAVEFARAPRLID